MTRVLKTAALCAALVLGCVRAGEAKPNILIILSDDQGYADVSFNPHHPKEVATPHTDALAKSRIGTSKRHIPSPVGRFGRKYSRD